MSESEPLGHRHSFREPPALLLSPGASHLAVDEEAAKATQVDALGSGIARRALRVARRKVGKRSDIVVREGRSATRLKCGTCDDPSGHGSALVWDGVDRLRPGRFIRW